MSVTSNMIKKATFAMGCFWGCDALFGCAPGVIRTRVGYCGGTSANPTYYHISDYTESIDIDYDSNKTSYEKLLELFWRNHEPTVSQKRQYMSAIFYHDEEQRTLAEETKNDEEKKLHTPIVTKIMPYSTFYNAEGYHQKYYLQTFHLDLCKSLNLTEDDLINSTVAAKLNGYVTGHGSLEIFDAECSTLGLSPTMLDYVRKQIKNPQHLTC